MNLRRVSTLTDHYDVDYLQSLALPDDKPADIELGYWWIVYDRDTPAAFAGMVPSRQWSDCMYLCRSGVAPTYRGLGLQTRLIRVREQYARRLGMAWLVSDTTMNPASANNLADCGFRMYEPSAPWGNRYTLYWRKKVRT